MLARGQADEREVVGDIALQEGVELDQPDRLARAGDGRRGGGRPGRIGLPALSRPARRGGVLPERAAAAGQG